MQNDEHTSRLTVSENGLGRYQQTIRVGQHTLIADEPVAADGGDAGPAPYDFLMAGLGACTSMTLRMYAERKGISLTRVHVELSHHKVDDEVEGRLDCFERNITLEGNLSDEQRQRMLEIANKCPVYRTLSSNVRISSRLAG